MAQRYYPQDADLAALEDRTIAVLGYGNQGRSQALNLAQSGLEVIVGNRGDAYRSRAEDDGLLAYTIEEATARADVLLLLLPDEVQQEVFTDAIGPHLRDGVTLCFAHGYNVFYKRLDVPADADVVLVAPKMIGDSVREWYVQRKQFPTLVAVEQDASGRALQTTLALALGMGGMGPAFESSFEEETVTDLFGEQVGGASGLVGMLRSFETLVAAGYDPEIVQLELYGSGELAEVMQLQYRYGVINQLDKHSPTSAYGQIARAHELLEAGGGSDYLERVLRELQDGTFAQRWERVQDGEYQELRRLRAGLESRQLFEVERTVRELLAEGADASGEDGA